LKILSHIEKQDRRAKSIGYHIALGFIVKVPSWVKFFIHLTHPMETEFASLPLNLLVNMTFSDDPSHVVASSCRLVEQFWQHLDHPATFNDWLKLANQVCATNHNFTS